MSRGLDPGRIARLSGFGMNASADGYVYRPASVGEVVEVLRVATEAGRKVVLRGSGLSYGDAAILSEAIVLDVSAMRRILAFDPETGLLEAEAGATIEDLWRTCLPQGWWPPVVSGTMFPTLAGALAMNIHGKNAFKAGPIGEHVREIDVVTGDGRLVTLGEGDPRLDAVIGSAGLLGCIVRVKLQMKRVASGDLRVLAISARSWDEQFEAFERHTPEADYVVSWIDAFARGSSEGRGQLHVAWHTEGDPSTLQATHQDLPSRILGVLPKSQVWRFLKPFNNRFGMRALNAAKHLGGRYAGNGKEVRQSLVAFSFLLDYVPDWRKAYLPGGFIQYQSFVPKEAARKVFSAQLRLQQEAGLESFLAVMKRHRQDRFLLSHGVDGYSLALDFKLTESTRSRVWELAHRMNDLVLEAGGRFYFAKDSTLRPEDADRYLGAETLQRLREAKREWDLHEVLSSALAERLRLLKHEKGPADAGPIEGEPV